MRRSENGEKPANGDGRDARGRFVPGCQPGPGAPHGSTIARFRGAFLAAVTPEEIAAVARKLLELALGGDVPAARLLLDRLAPQEVEAFGALPDGIKLNPITLRTVERIE